MTRRTIPTAAICIAAAWTALAATAPATAQEAVPTQPSRMPAPGAPANPVGVCDRNENLLDILIPPGLHAIPFWVRPFTGHDETPPELLALWDECRPRLVAAEPLVNWKGQGRGLKPMVDVQDVVRGADIQRGGLPNRVPTDRQLRRGDPVPPTRP